MANLAFTFESVWYESTCLWIQSHWMPDCLRCFQTCVNNILVFAFMQVPNGAAGHYLLGLIYRCLPSLVFCLVYFRC